MAKYIERESLIKHLKQFAPESYNELINNLIMKEPTVNIDIFVQCKNCKKCSEQKVKECEAEHLNLSVEEYQNYLNLMREADYCGFVVSQTNNVQTRKQFDIACEKLADFEIKHDLGDIRLINKNNKK